jgi:hypothetical protein
MEKEGKFVIRKAKLSDVNQIYELGLKTEELEFSSEFPFHEKSELREFISKPKENILFVVLIDKKNNWLCLLKDIIKERRRLVHA